MEKVISIEAEKEKINATLNQVRDLRENFLMWAINDESPAKYPEDLLFFLRVFDDVDKHFVGIMNKVYEQE